MLLVDLEEIGKDMGPFFWGNFFFFFFFSAKPGRFSQWDRAAAVGQKAGLGQHIGAGAEAADRDGPRLYSPPRAGQASHGNGARNSPPLMFEAGADDDHGGALDARHLATFVLKGGIDGHIPPSWKRARAGRRSEASRQL